MNKKIICLMEDFSLGGAEAQLSALQNKSEYFLCFA